MAVAKANIAVEIISATEFKAPTTISEIDFNPCVSVVDIILPTVVINVPSKLPSSFLPGAAIGVGEVVFLPY